MLEKGKLKVTITILDIQYDNIWTNIRDDLIKRLNPAYGDALHVVFTTVAKAYEGDALYSQTFGALA